MKFLKWLAIILAILVVAIFIYAKIQINSANNRLEKAYDLSVGLIPIPGDSVSLARGAHLTNVLCTECHGFRLEGKMFFSDPSLADIPAPNLTSGKGGIGSTYSDQDWLRALRNGVKPNGRPIFIMPSKNFAQLCEADIASIIAHLKTIEPVDLEHPAPVYAAFGKFLLGTGAFGDDIISAEVLDHASVPEPCKEFENEVELGKYIVNFGGCTTCHGPQLNGAASPDPHSPFSPNLTSAGNLGNWDVQDFIRTMRSGVTPEGKTLDVLYMPWKSIGNLNDTELSAMYSYLKSLQPLPEPDRD